MQIKFMNMPIEGYKLNETLKHMRGAHANRKPNKITLYVSYGHEFNSRFLKYHKYLLNIINT